ncbi:PstS family phosphate ABC transporter substrate-binding protein [Ureaplasma canigenitalium]|uniref:PstS family phosphate ABC transporter substrate-binding protein n=1 Tax=Ureaplasma canigenitalium TaxID=42092 RepID=UPI00068A82DC|nr:substrate-binding domain-containing protein [Ureaplasma canigenitalium]
MKLRYKILGTSFFVISAIGIIAAVSVPKSTKKLIYLSGSSSLQPLMKELGKFYPNADIIADAGGSLTGIISAINNQVHIGLASRNVNIDEEKKTIEKQHNLYQTWQKNNTKIVTLAYDGIAILYKIKDFHGDLVLNKNNIEKLYRAFQGNEEFYYDQFDQQLPHLKLKPYIRSGGALASGTTEAFLVTNPLINLKKTNKDIYNTIHDGTYGMYVRTTEESNIQAFQNMVNDNLDGAITYISTGFLINNYKEIKDKGYQVAKIFNDETGIGELPFHNDDDIKINIAKTYHWYRPFILLYSKNQKEVNEIENFIDWLKKSEESANIINKQGFIKKED